MSKMDILNLWLIFKLKKLVKYSNAVLVEELIIEGWPALFFWWPEDFYRWRMRLWYFPQLAMS
jgi:hypothetical protein